MHPEETERLLRVEQYDPKAEIKDGDGKYLEVISDWSDIYYYDARTKSKKTQLALIVGFDKGGSRPNDDFINERGYYLLICFRKAHYFRCIKIFDASTDTQISLLKAKNVAKKYGRAIVEKYISAEFIDWENPHHENVRSFSLVENVKPHIVSALLQREYIFRIARPIRKCKLV